LLRDQWLAMRFHCRLKMETRLPGFWMRGFRTSGLLRAQAPQMGALAWFTTSVAAQKSRLSVSFGRIAR
jgi:hypothetical protein